MQWFSLVGNIKEPYYSCVKFNIKGGNPNMNCALSGGIPTPKCLRSGGPAMDGISRGTKKGSFCYHGDRVGHIDDDIARVPINVDCDPRITCQLSIWDGCKNELTGIEVWMLYLEKSKYTLEFTVESLSFDISYLKRRLLFEGYFFRVENATTFEWELTLTLSRRDSPHWRVKSSGVRQSKILEVPSRRKRVLLMYATRSDGQCYQGQTRKNKRSDSLTIHGFENSITNEDV